MIDARFISRSVLCGSDTGWMARVGCGPRGIAALAAIGLALQMLDLLTGIRMMLSHGTLVEQNLIARTLFEAAGPMGLAMAKCAVVFSGVALLVLMARLGRGRLARNALLLVAILGLLGIASNQV